ncbi:hypothetical protein IE53DRAFT_252377 [Violaceomyces palustris]|uniref:Uncharacterized protein n=1 Tax=Violaceomyces palustris TaxID=1673888 RepID=A0ACD0NNI4_9BASI|nr:hypothetical protein IE53DRAFT_252377 [Violaceomyces palustris]
MLTQAWAEQEPSWVNSSSLSSTWAPVAKRQRQPSISCHSYTARVGDGNPHQNHRFTQVSESLTCASIGCTKYYSASETVSYSISAGGGGFVYLGFDVTRSRGWEEGTNCPADPWQPACLWVQTDLTAYSAQRRTRCHRLPSGEQVSDYASADPYVIYAPNKRQCGLTYHCRNGGSHCSKKGGSYLMPCGPRGTSFCNYGTEDGWGSYEYHRVPSQCR